MSTTTNLMSFAEFERLPDPPDGCRYELHHGELVTAPPPSFNHWDIADRLADLLKLNLSNKGRAGIEFAFRALPEGEFRVADVFFASADRMPRSRVNHFEGSPDLAVEILSPSNSASEMDDRERICLATGSLEFWRIDPRFQTIRVTTRDGRVTTYTKSDSIALSAFGSPAKIAVADVLTD